MSFHFSLLAVALAGVALVAFAADARPELDADQAIGGTDAAVFAVLGAGFEAQVNIENLLGEDYFPTAHNDNNISPGAPTSARFTVRRRF